MFQDYPQSQQLQQQNICAECSHKSNHPLPFLAAHHVVRTPVSAHVSRPVRSSEREEANDDEYWYPSPKPRPHHLASSSLSAESLPSPDPSISSILSSSPSQAETWRTSLSNNGQGRPSLEGVSASSGKGKLQRHHFYAANMHNPQQERPQQQQHQQQQRQQAVNLGRKASGDYDDNPSQGSPYRGTVYTYTSDEMLGDSGSSPSSPKQHTVWILIYLSFISPFLSLPIALYTLLITPILILLSPLSLLTTSYPSLHTQLRTFLSPPINAQLHFIFSSTTTFLASSSSDDDGPANPVMLFLVNILSPIYAVGIGLSAWVAALFWFYAAILGDPDGEYRDGRDDGRAAVLGVRRCWEGWLEQAR